MPRYHILLPKSLIKLDFLCFFLCWNIQHVLEKTVFQNPVLERTPLVLEKTGLCWKKRGCAGKNSNSVLEKTTPFILIKSDIIYYILSYGIFKHIRIKNFKR